MGVLVIAEAACTWRFGWVQLETARRSIKAAKACGADVWKTQWTSDGHKMAARRGEGCRAADMYEAMLGWPVGWHGVLRMMCAEAGLEYMCTVFLAEDIERVEPHVKRWKVSAREALDGEFVQAHGDRPFVVSLNPGMPKVGGVGIWTLHCVSKYPCPVGELGLREGMVGKDGFSDHSMSLVSGAVAVALGARILEKHVRLLDTPSSNPDYGHSLVMDGEGFGAYVANVREAESVLGGGR